MSNSVRWVSRRKSLSIQESPKKSKRPAGRDLPEKGRESRRAPRIRRARAPWRSVVAIMLQPGDDGIHRHHLPGATKRLRRHDLTPGPAAPRRDRGQHDQRLVAAVIRESRQRCQPLRQDAHAATPGHRAGIPGRNCSTGRSGAKNAARGQLLQAGAIAANHREADGGVRPRRDGGARSEITSLRRLGTLAKVSGAGASKAAGILTEINERFHAS